jgi:DNA-directed RNA polymerase specialized sigma24 family protein
MKTKNRPWLNSNEKPICVSTLRRIAKDWDAETWEAYLVWYQTPRKEALITSLGYALKCEGILESIYQEYGYAHDELIAKYVEKLLSSLPKNQASVLRLHFLKGLTERQVSRRVRKSHQCVNVRKSKALFQLARKNPEENVAAIRIMRGLFAQNETREALESELFEDKNKKERICDPDAFDTELLAIDNANVKRAIAELTEHQRRAVYLRFWSGLSFSEIARRLGVGINCAQDLCDVGVFKIKNRVTELSQAQSKKEKVKTTSCVQQNAEFMTETQEVSSCA